MKYSNTESVPFEIVRGATPTIVRIGNRYAIAGTEYGWLHDCNGSVALWNSRATAKRRLAAYAPLGVAA